MPKSLQTLRSHLHEVLQMKINLYDLKPISIWWCVSRGKSEGMTKWQWGKGWYYVNHILITVIIYVCIHISKTHQNVHFILNLYTFNYASASQNKNLKQRNRFWPTSLCSPSQLPTSNANTQNHYEKQPHLFFQQIFMGSAMCHFPLQLLQIKQNKVNKASRHVIITFCWRRKKKIKHK